MCWHLANEFAPTGFASATGICFRPESPVAPTWHQNYRSIPKRPCRNKRPALIHPHRVIGGWHWLGFDFLAEDFRRVLGLEIQVRRKAVVPPDVFVVRHTVDRGVANIGGEQRLAQQVSEV